MSKLKSIVMRTISMLCLKFAVLIAGATLSATEVGQAAEWRAAVSAALGRAPDQLELLDRSPVSFAFVSGRYAVFVVRDLQSTEVLEVTINLENEQPVKELELRELDRSRSIHKGARLHPSLREVVLRHPDLKKVSVRLHFDPTVANAQGEGPSLDWIDPLLRQRFQALINSEFKRLRIDAPLRLRSDYPYQDAELSVGQIVQLGQSPLVKAVDLLKEPVVLDP